MSSENLESPRLSDESIDSIAMLSALYNNPGDVKFTEDEYGQQAFEFINTVSAAVPGLMEQELDLTGDIPDLIAEYLATTGEDSRLTGVDVVIKPGREPSLNIDTQEILPERKTVVILRIKSETGFPTAFFFSIGSMDDIEPVVFTTDEENIKLPHFAEDFSEQQAILLDLICRRLVIESVIKYAARQLSEDLKDL